jgi:hypothetical protein
VFTHDHRGRFDGLSRPINKPDMMNGDDHVVSFRSET